MTVRQTPAGPVDSAAKIAIVGAGHVAVGDRAGEVLYPAPLTT